MNSSEHPEDTTPTGDGDRLVTIAGAANEVEAQLLVATLADEGIDAVVFPLGSSLLQMATPARRFSNSIPVQVHARDAGRASAIIAERRSERRNLNWEQVDVGDRVDQVALRDPAPVPLSIRVIAIGAITLLATSCIIGGILAISQGGESEVASPDEAISERTAEEDRP